MCGIFGVFIDSQSKLDSTAINNIVKSLYLQSETRGKEASGMIALGEHGLHYGKSAMAPSQLVRSSEFNQALQRRLTEFEQGKVPCFAWIGHSRLVTNGLQENNLNNQPVVSGKLVGVHNGIVVNDKDLWEKYPGLARQGEVDTEGVLATLQGIASSTNDMQSLLKTFFDDIYGTASVAVLSATGDAALLATNCGSLYYAVGADPKIVIFASERFILESVLAKAKATFQTGAVQPLAARKGFLIDFKTLSLAKLDANDSKISPFISTQAFFGSSERPLIEEKLPGNYREHALHLPVKSDFPTAEKEFDLFFSEVEGRVKLLKRCTRCILPETMPFIEFDHEGVCNFCRHYKPMKVQSHAALQQKIEPHLKDSSSKQHNCLVTFSGGRDSCYALHYIVRELKLKPVAYSYDWGMITDLGRRNQARMCGRLGVEHIIVSADIRKKRDNIRRNVSAWLAQPNLGTIPLFMAGDKQYFYYANQIMKQTALSLVALCVNPLEKTDFKSGYCGVAPNFSEKSVYNLSLFNKARMAWFYGWQFLKNPRYMNRSVLDTLSAFSSYYVINHDFISLYDYLRWDENEINQVLLGEYDWELAEDTSTTWRIGDGTAAFYNYIYYVMSGFTENDTFRSNQVREGVLTRAEALALAAIENRPRYPSLRWYCHTIGIDYVSAMKRINQFAIGAPVGSTYLALNQAEQKN